MKTADFYYELPESLIAQTPLEPRDSSRLMLLNRKTGEINHKHFYDIVDYLNEGDCLIVNDSRVLPARIYGTKHETGANVEFLLLKQVESTRWECLVKPGKKAREGAKFTFGDGIMNGTIIEVKEDGNRVMMCGDGINDSPALANADIGVSVKSGTDIAMDSSDVILTKNDLDSILKLIKISERTIKNIKQNLFWAFFYNCLMIPVAMGLLKPFGISINPMIASLAMVFSSFTVILNALRLRKNKN